MQSKLLLGGQVKACQMFTLAIMYAQARRVRIGKLGMCSCARKPEELMVSHCGCRKRGGVCMLAYSIIQGSEGYD